MAKKITFGEIGETLAFIVERMATKDDVRAIIRAEVPGIVREQTQDIRDELASIRRDLKELKEKADNTTGLTKEIDHALERIGAIEKHLGINKKIAA